MVEWMTKSKRPKGNQCAPNIILKVANPSEMKAVSLKPIRVIESLEIAITPIGPNEANSGRQR